MAAAANAVAERRALEEEETAVAAVGKGVRAKKAARESVQSARRAREREEREARRLPGRVFPSDLTDSRFTLRHLADPRVLRHGFVFV